MFKVSRHKALIWLSLVSLVLNLCKKSLRILLIFSCTRATFTLCFSLFLLPFCLRDNFCCSIASLDKYLLNTLGLLTFSPVESVQKSLTPKSIPMVVSRVIALRGLSCVSSSNNTLIKYLPLGTCLTVQVRIIPSKVLSIFALTQPTFGT